MEIFLTFLEGFMSFISPCLLPLLPIYLSFIIGENENVQSKKLFRAIAFVSGFTLIFVMMGVFSATLGSFIYMHKYYIDIVFGLIMILIGLNYLNIINIKIFNITKKYSKDITVTSMYTAFLFGVFFSLGFTPCIGAFLGSALMMASTSGSVFQGMLYLLSYSLGIGIPFIISALFFEKTKKIQVFIKSHYLVVNRVSGSILILIGLYKIYGSLGVII